MAYTLMNQILPQVDLGVDFHTGGASRSNFPQIRCSFNLPESKEYAKAFAPPVVLHSTLISKSFRYAAHKKGKPILVYEAGESLRISETGVIEGINGTRRLMKHLGMITTEVPLQNQVKMYRKSTWLRANKSGLYRPKADLGADINKGQELGHVNDPFGGKSTKVVFSGVGKIIGQNYNPIVHKGDALIHIAYN